MLLDDLWQFITEVVFVQASSTCVFNQYSDRCSAFDRPSAVSIRRGNLCNYLHSFRQRPTYLLIGEAPGPRGCRFSGVPFTSEDQLVSGSLGFAGQQSSNRKEPYKEATATIVWDTLQQQPMRPFLWNCVPFHPHKHDDLLSIRAPTDSEIRSYGAILRGVIDALSPVKIVCIGKKAAIAIRDLGVPAEHVRHPSRGGAAEFRAGLRRALSIQVSVSNGDGNPIRI